MHRNPSDASAGHPELMLSAVLYLLPTCSLHGLDAAKAQALVRHREIIAGNAHIDELMCATASQLMTQWQLAVAPNTTTHAVH